MDADNVDDLAFFANTLAQAQSLLNRLKQAARSIGFYVNSDKIEFVFYTR